MQIQNIVGILAVSLGLLFGTAASDCLPGQVKIGEQCADCDCSLHPEDRKDCKDLDCKETTNKTSSTAIPVPSPTYSTELDLTTQVDLSTTEKSADFRNESAAAIGLSAGPIAGISIAAVIFFVIFSIVIAIAVYFRRRQGKQRPAIEEDPQNPEKMAMTSADLSEQAQNVTS